MPMIVIDNRSKLNEKQVTAFVSDLFADNISSVVTTIQQSRIDVETYTDECETGNKTVTIIDSHDLKEKEKIVISSKPNYKRKRPLRNGNS